MTSPDAGEDKEQQELASSQGGTQNGAATTLEHSLAVSHQMKNTPATLSSRHGPWYLPSELKTYGCSKLSMQL